MKKAYKELLDFFEFEEGWDKKEIIEMLGAKTMTQLGCVAPTKTKDPVPLDEVNLCWGIDHPLKQTLQEFSEVFFDEVIKGVCNVIKTA